MAAARLSGVSLEELHRRASAGKFASPSKPINPRVLV
jgi:hypothetical protein